MTDKNKKLISSIYENLMIEVSILFYDGSDEKLPKNIEKTIEELSTQHFIEFIQEDLEKETTEKISMTS